MKNSKGQALIEFIIILPILLIILISIVDFGNIILKKYSLENDLDTVCELYKSKDYDKIDSYIKNNNIKLNYVEDGKFNLVKLNKSVKVMSPLLYVIFGKNYDIEVSRSIYE